MNKIAFLLFFTLFSFFAHAGDYNYRCFNIDDFAFFDYYGMSLSISDGEVSLTMKDPEYSSIPTKQVQEMPKNSRFVKVNLKSSDANVETQFDIEPLLIEKVLFEGGKKLRKGDLGGFVKFLGQGYSYENYLCVEK